MSTPDNSREGSSLRPIRAVTFDLAETLIHAPRLVETYWQVLSRHGHRVKLEDVRREVPRVAQEFSCRVDHRVDRFTSHTKGAEGYWQEYLERLCQRLETTEPSRFAGAELFNRLAHREVWEVYPDVCSTLQRLRDDGLRIGVVSNWDHRLPRLLERLGLHEYFDAVTYSSSCGIEKPHPGIFLHCLKSLGVPAANALHVGDCSIDDVEGAEAAGLRALRIDRSAGGDHLQPLLDSLLRRPVLHLLSVDGGNRQCGGDQHVRN